MNEGKAERIYKSIMLIILTAGITFIITSMTMYNKIGQNPVKIVSSSSSTSSAGKTIDIFHDFIKKNYLKDMDEEKMIEMALKGYVKGLGDDYSEYITKEEMKSYMEKTVGKYVGIGVYLANDTEKDRVMILAPMKDSPAEKAGLQPGDYIIKVDGVEYKGSQLSEATAALKTKEGTIAKVEILRGEETLNYEIERKEIKINHINSQVLENKIGYIRISSFDDGCYTDFKNNYQSLKDQGIESLIIDLRGNGGGIVDEATKIADLFVDKDKNLLIMSSKNAEEKITKSQSDKEIDIPVVILVNNGTASASEILAAAMKENNDKVTIVGKNTYGKGVIQTIYNLADGSGIKLTTNEYYTPNHNVINKVGIKPDEEVEFPEGKSIYRIEQKDDTQLQKAIEILK